VKIFNWIETRVVVVCFELTLAHYKSKTHQIWNESFPSTSVTETKLIVGTRNNSNLTKELVRRSPRVQKREHQQQLP
jgi:hypothetical protein